MEKRSKTNKEIYEEKYPIYEVSENPFLCAEAIGYLKALKQYFPYEEIVSTFVVTTQVAELDV